MSALHRHDPVVKELRSGAIYSSVVLTLALGVCTVLIVVVLPNFVQLFDEFKVSLPPSTRILLGFATFSATYPIEVVATLLLIVFGFVFLRTRPRDSFWGHVIPLIEPVLTIAALAAIGFVALSVIMPMYGLLQQVR